MTRSVEALTKIALRKRKRGSRGGKKGQGGQFLVVENLMMKM